MGVGFGISPGNGSQSGFQLGLTEYSIVPCGCVSDRDSGIFPLSTPALQSTPAAAAAGLLVWLADLEEAVAAAVVVVVVVWLAKSTDALDSD